MLDVEQQAQLLKSEPSSAQHSEENFKHQEPNVDEDEPSYSLTIFYMPHCAKALYNNLLYANWSSVHLARFVIVGNSFATMRLMALGDAMRRSYSYIEDSTV